MKEQVSLLAEIQVKEQINIKEERIKLGNIQFLRGLAAFVVVIYHVATYETKGLLGNHYRFLSVFESFGFAGVDLFFVLSGFIITFIHLPEIGQPKKYLFTYCFKRFVRVYPLYWICFFSSFVLINIFRYWKGSSTCADYNNFEEMSKSILLLPQIHNCYLPVAWTLQYEIVFYLIFALLIISRYALFLVLILLLMSNNSLYYAFGLGAVIALFTFNNKWKHSFSFIPLWGQRVVSFGVPSAALVYLAYWLEKNRGIQSPKWLQELGNASYSVYLIHMPCQLVLMNLFKAHPISNVYDYSLRIFTLIIFPLMAGFILHYTIEKPMLKYFRTLIQY